MSLVSLFSVTVNATESEHTGNVSVSCGNVVIKVLTPTMFSVSPAAIKEQTSADLGVVNLNFEKVTLDVEKNKHGVCTITTDSIVITCDPAKEFLKGGITVAYRRVPAFKLNSLTAKDSLNLGGVIGSLDNCKGDVKYAEQNDVTSKCELHLIPNGILSRRGFTVMKHNPDTLSLYRENDMFSELYIMAYGNNYRQAMADFYSLAGSVPLLPRWSLGFIYSRWKDYTAADYKCIVNRFRSEGIPIDAIILDMCWHVDYWYGYRYDTHNFPDMRAFHLWTDSVHVKTGFNHHSGCIYSKDPHINEFCRLAGLDYDKALIPGLSWEPDKKVIHYDTKNNRQFKAFYDIYLSPLIKDGLDFLWVDGEKSIYSSELYQSYLSKETHKRPFVMNRLHDDVLCNHRYPVGFSGDTYISWETMAYSLEADIKGANCGVYWSHDIGGYMPQGPGGYPPSAEMFARWLQLGAVSPIFRVHAKKDVYWTPPCKPGEFDQGSRLPWEWGDTVLASAKTSIRLRYQLLPYIYSMVWKAHTSGLPLCRGVYIDYPGSEGAYRYDEFKFGDQLLAAPVLTQSVKGVKDMTAERQVWLPDGEWYDYFTHQRYLGNQTISVAKSIYEFPLYVKAGSIIPEAPYRPYSGAALDTLVLKVYTPELSCKSQFILYEDDGETFDFQHNEFRTIVLSYKYLNKQRHQIILGKAAGNYAGQVNNRAYKLIIMGSSKPVNIKIDSKFFEDWSWNETAKTMTIMVPSASVYQERKITINL
jgi:alpha-glucosidase (family GH31 glycosyl hydrolase)